MGVIFYGPWQYSPWLPPHLAARELGITRKTLKRYIRDGCPSRGNSVRVDDVLAWLESRDERTG